MAEKNVAVPQTALDRVEKARVELYDLAAQQGWTNDPFILSRLTEITSPMWEVGNRKYTEVKSDA